MARVFVSYRREDAAPWAGRICDRLNAAFGADHVFMDVVDISPGADFVHAIEKTVTTCDVLVAVIGPRWLEILRERPTESDFVEREIETALRRGVAVIPVLAGGAVMPSENELPSSISGLARRRAMSVRDTDFDRDAAELTLAVQRATGGGRSAKRLVLGVVAVGILIALTGSAYLLLRSRADASLDGQWIARMQRAGQRPYNIRLDWRVNGDTLTGTVEYPTGSGVIETGTVRSDSIQFQTRHIPQFETEPAVIRFRGEVHGTTVDLVATMPDGGIAKGIARKAGL